MVNLTALWMPVLISAVIVFFASWVAHMLLPFHRKDYVGLPGEARIAEAIRNEKVPPGNYMCPHIANPKDLGTPEAQEKFKAGPVFLMNVWPSGPPAMGKSLAQWFVFCLLVGTVSGYLAGVTLPPGEGYRRVFRVVSTAALLGYSMGPITESIWKGQRWSSTIKHMVDGLIYALLTGGVFGWLWPEA